MGKKRVPAVGNRAHRVVEHSRNGRLNRPSPSVDYNCLRVCQRTQALDMDSVGVEFATICASNVAPMNPDFVAVQISSRAVRLVPLWSV